MENKLEHKNIVISGFEVKEDDNGTIMEGYASTFNNLDSYNDTIIKGAFADTIKGENGERIAFCYQHKMNEPIGKIESLREDDKGLFVSVRISKSEDKIATKVKEGILSEMSIGYWAEIKEYNDETGIRTLKKINLHEISLVTRAADAFAKVTAIKAEDLDLKKMDYEELKALQDKLNIELKSREPECKTWLSFLNK